MFMPSEQTEAYVLAKVLLLYVNIIPIRLIQLQPSAFSVQTDRQIKALRKF